MSQPGQIIIERKKRMPIFVLIGCAFLLFNFGGNILSSITEGFGFSIGRSFSFLINLAITIVSAAAGYQSLHKLIDNKPGLIINNMGIMDNSGLVSAGMVFWSDITGIDQSRVIFTDCVMIRVKNPQRYINGRKNVLNRIWLWLENYRTGSPVNISKSGLEYDEKELFRLIQDRYLATHVESKTFELKREKETILREKRELLDSINYAKRIQTALLPSEASIRQRIGDNFILYLPKNIVSGDFYWVEAEGEHIFFAVCDCTGHGVPGALINIICTNALNRAVREFGIIEPGKILDKVSELVVASIGQDGENRDGMDASLCTFNTRTRELLWAGANIPLWIARDEIVYELLEYKPDKRSIGYTELQAPFNTQQIEIRKNDIIYMSSDGYADQFGGDAGKKMTRKKFKEVLLLQRGKELSEQKDNLLSFHSDYKGKVEQIDDILVMGVRVEQ